MSFDLLLKKMEECPHKFSFDQYTLVYADSRFSVWIGNGIFSYGLYTPFKHRFSLIQKIRFHRALKRLKDRKLSDLLREAK
jgi:hypothetical protein